MNDGQTSIAQRSLEKLHFDHQDMDYYLSWVVGREIYGGSERSECMATAARIPNADVESWHREWLALASRVEAEAETAMSSGDPAKARGAYLRACSYYRAPLFIMRREAPEFMPAHEKMVTCFRKAAALFDPPLEQIEVSFEGYKLPGYLWKADTPRKNARR